MRPRAAAGARRREAPPPAVCERVAAAIRQVETQQPGEDHLTLDDALGMSPILWNRARRRRRDAMIRAAHQRFLPDLSLRAAARQLVNISRELQSGRVRSRRDT